LYIELAVQAVMAGHKRRRELSNKIKPKTDTSHPTLYRIRIKGQLVSKWTDWFEGMIITLEDGDTLVTGPVVDQAALHGLLKKVRDLGMPLVSVCPVEPDPPSKLGTGQADQSDVSE
jgi:hypothetical protein